MSERQAPMTAKEAWAILSNARIKFWTCPSYPEHRFVTWSGDVATCDECGTTNASGLTGPQRGDA